MATIINNRKKIGDRLKEVVARLVSYDNDGTTIQSSNMQDALDEVIVALKGCMQTEDVEGISVEPTPRDADTLGGRVTAEDFDQLNSDLDTFINTTKAASGGGSAIKEFTQTNQSYTFTKDCMIVIRITYSSPVANVYDAIALNGLYILENSLPVSYYNFTSQSIFVHKGDVITARNLTAQSAWIYSIN